MDGWIVRSRCRPQAAFKLAHRGPIGDSSWLAEMERWRDETARNARTAGPPKFGHGGARPGAGRKKRTLNEITPSSNEKEAAEQDRARLGKELLEARTKPGHGGSRPGAGRKKRTQDEITQSWNQKLAAKHDRARLGKQLMNDITLGGYPEVASKLLADGADVDFARERGGTTLLSAAAGDRNCSVVDVLISHGAKVDRYQGQALRAAVRCECFGNGHRDLNGVCTAAADLSCLSALLNAKANVNLVYKAGSIGGALHSACYCDTTSVAIPVLLTAGADIELRDFCGRTPLLEAAYHGSVRCFKLLHRHGAKLGAKDKHGYGVRFELDLSQPEGELEGRKSIVAKGRLAIRGYLEYRGYFIRECFRPSGDEVAIFGRQRAKRRLDAARKLQRWFRARIAQARGHNVNKM